jgi:hypothetical protein
VMNNRDNPDFCLNVFLDVYIGLNLMNKKIPYFQNINIQRFKDNVQIFLSDLPQLKSR